MLKLDRAKFALAMARACLTPAQLAEAANMPRPSINNALSGRNVLPATLGRIARALGVDVTEILAEEVVHSEN